MRPFLISMFASKDLLIQIQFRGIHLLYIRQLSLYLHVLNRDFAGKLKTFFHKLSNCLRAQPCQ